MTNTNLRLPDEIYEKLREIAKLEDRSINGQMVHIIREYIENYFEDREGLFIETAPAGVDSTDRGLPSNRGCG